MSVFTVIDPAAPLVFGPFAAGSVPATRGASGTQTVTTPGAGSFVWPADVDRVTVQCWGAGSGGGSGAAETSAGGGGGGGAYSTKIVLGVPGESYPYVVGAGGAGGIQPGGLATAGADTTYRATEVVAKGGSRGSPATAGGVGGTASGGSGTTKFDGGNGASQDSGAGYAGGSSAGTAADGTDAVNFAAPVAPTGGGNGGAGGNDDDVVGSPGTAPGGAGGGGSIAKNGGAGAAGKIVFTW